MISPDVIEVLLHEHDQIRRLCAAVDQVDGDRKARAFTALKLYVRSHELGDRRVVHPAVRDSTPAGDAVGRACLVEEQAIEQNLYSFGVGDAGFDARFAALAAAILDHLAHEERDEFPLLRLYVPAQRLHMMAGQVHDVQVMGVG